MRILEWIAADRVDSEAAADRPVIEALTQAGHDAIRILPASCEGDPARPIRETAGLRRLPWNPEQAAWFEAGEIEAICEFHRGRGIDLVWARGRSAWRAASRAASRLGAPLWIELGSIPEATALARPPRGVDLLLTVASFAEAEVLRDGVRARLLQASAGGPLVVPPAIAPSAALPTPHDGRPVGHGGHGGGPSKIVVADSGRRTTTAAVRMIGSLLEAVQAWNRARTRDRTAIADPAAGRPVEIFFEDSLAERPSVRRLLRRLGADVASTGAQREQSEQHHESPKQDRPPQNTPPLAADRVVRIPPLGRCRGAIGDGDAVFAPQPLLRQRPAVLEAIAAGAMFVSPADPELASWFGDSRGDGPGGIELPSRGGTAARTAAIGEVLERLARPLERRTFASNAIRGLTPLLDPRTRVEAVQSAIGRVAGPHNIEFFLPDSAAQGASRGDL